METRNCPECGVRPPSRVHSGGSPRIFCSRRCARLGQHRRYHVKTAEKHRREIREWEKAHPEYAAFLKQRRSAAYRKIEWGLAFDSWLTWWGTDFLKRGRKIGSLQMCRTNDCGPYSLENIYKDTISSNVSFMRKRKGRTT